ADGLKRFRKFAIVGVFAAAALITPPDVISQVLLGIPVLLLYELSILAIEFSAKRRSEALADDGPSSESEPM
ncbi:MAG: twin-arginine translocase subunit TatC, partial [Pseudomonadota bacterium]